MKADDRVNRRYWRGVGKILVHLAVPLLLAVGVWAAIIWGAIKLGAVVSR